MQKTSQQCDESLALNCVDMQTNKKGGVHMNQAPKILLIMSKDEMIAYISQQNPSVSLYGCPSGNTYSNCHNS